MKVVLALVAIAFGATLKFKETIRLDSKFQTDEFEDENQQPKTDEQETTSSDDVDEDGNPYCEDCDTYHAGDCPVKKLFDIDGIIKDTQVPDGELLKAVLSVPNGLYITKSKMKRAGRGVHAYLTFHEGTVFGHYDGEIKPYNIDEIPSNYCWGIRRKGEIIHIVDGKDVRKSNWMRYVNCGINIAKSNVEAFRYKSNIYYGVVKTIFPGDEMLVWYGPTYGDYLNSIKEVPLFSCPVCGNIFTKWDHLLRHQMTHRETNSECIVSKYEGVASLSNQTKHYVTMAGMCAKNDE